MLLLSQSAGGGAISARRCPLTTTLEFINPKPPLFSNRKPKFISANGPRKPLNFLLAKADGGVDSSAAPKQPLSSSPCPPFENNDAVSLGRENFPLEGVIQFEKQAPSSLVEKWGRVALLAGGDVLALILFSAIGRFSHGFSVFDFETFRTADPFIAGWFLSAYFLGGYGEDGRGINGLPKAVIAAVKSWALGIPLGLIIRATMSGHIPSYKFILVTMGSTAVLLVGWRAVVISIFSRHNKKTSDVYRKGSPFELFELLTSLVRRW